MSFASIFGMECEAADMLDLAFLDMEFLLAESHQIAAAGA
jgi:hypothetical protein